MMLTALLPKLVGLLSFHIAFVLFYCRGLLNHAFFTRSIGIYYYP